MPVGWINNINHHSLSSYCVQNTSQCAFHIVSHSVLITTPQGRFCCYFHFPYKETEVSRSACHKACECQSQDSAPSTGSRVQVLKHLVYVLSVNGHTDEWGGQVVPCWPVLAMCWNLSVPCVGPGIMSQALWGLEAGTPLWAWAFSMMRTPALPLSLK